MESHNARGIGQSAANPHCQTLAAKEILDLSEDVFRDLLTGHPGPQDHGERPAALRRRRAFETHLADNDARALLRSLDGQLGINPATARVLDLRREVPGESQE